MHLNMMSFAPSAAVSGLLLILSGLCLAAPTPQTTAIVGAKLVDGSGGPPIETSIILIRGERILAAGTRRDVSIPESANILNAVGKVVIPGLVDLHCHFGGGREALERLFALQLEFGVTTARSLGADNAENTETIALAKRGQIKAPRMYTAGRGFSHPQGMPPGEVIQRPTTEAEAREMVRQLAAIDVDMIKMWVDPTLDGLLAWGFDWNDGTAPIPKISPEIRTALVTEAAKFGIPAVAHIYEEEDVRQLNAVGVSHFVHTVRSAPVDTEFVRWAKQQKLSFTPALSKAQDSWYLAEHPEELDDPGLQNAFGAERIAQLRSPETQASMLANPQGDQLRMMYGRMQRFIRQVNDAGVVVAVGSDSGAGNVAFGWGPHHEMELLVEAGLTPLEAITAGTRNGAWVLEGDDAQFGTIEAGKMADLIILTADPTSDISNSRTIESVMQSGRWLSDN